MLSYSISNRDRGRVRFSDSPYPALVSYIVESVNSDGEPAYYWMVRERERDRERQREREQRDRDRAEREREREREILNPMHCVGG